MSKIRRKKRRPNDFEANAKRIEELTVRQPDPKRAVLDKGGALVEKFLSRIDFGPHIAGCWIWSGGATRKGQPGGEYGRISIGKDAPKYISDIYRSDQTISAHRIAWMIANERGLPEDIEVVHKCRISLCVNPSHLDVATRYQNWARSIAPTRVNFLKSHCDRGHLLEGENLSIYRSDTLNPRKRRKCRICSNETSKEYRQRHQKAAERHVPTIGELEAIVAAKEPWDEAGARYGVSGVAIRKRAKRAGLDVSRKRAGARIRRPKIGSVE